MKPDLQSIYFDSTIEENYIKIYLDYKFFNIDKLILSEKKIILILRKRFKMFLENCI